MKTEPGWACGLLIAGITGKLGVSQATAAMRPLHMIRSTVSLDQSRCPSRWADLR